MLRMQTHFSYKKNIYLLFLLKVEIFSLETIVEGASGVHSSLSHSIHDLQVIIYVIFLAMNQPMCK